MSARTALAGSRLCRKAPGWVGAMVSAGSLWLAPVAGAQTVVMSEEFDTSVPASIDPGVATITGVQGYAGLGSPGNQFGGSFLRSPTGNVVTLTLTGLPQHTAISIQFLFAAIDSLDGTGNFPEGDFFRVTLDGTPFFRESFANALPTQIQSYVPPPGGELARRIDLGFSGPGSYYTDSAYDFGVDPRFLNLPHTGSTAVFTFQIEGPGIQPLDDESWAMDHLRITVGARPCGAIDCDGDGLVQPADIACFVNLWFTSLQTSTLGGDYDGDGAVQPADVAAFVTDWFAALTGGC